MRKSIYKDWTYWAGVISIWSGAALFIPPDSFLSLKYCVTFVLITLGISLLNVDRQ